MLATQEAAKIFRHIAEKKGVGNFVTEVSMDEVDEAQTPIDLLFILKSLAETLRVPVQTIAPKFTGRFNKGVDYVGDVVRFGREFEDDLMVIDYAVDHFGLPSGLKLSVHSGSDKFSIYPVMGRLLRKYNKGIHVKTAGTSWLEEIIGLALGGEDGLALAKSIYAQAYGRQAELCAPYAAVIDIRCEQLPTPATVEAWSGERFAAMLQHEPGNPHFDPERSATDSRRLQRSLPNLARRTSRRLNAIAMSLPVVWPAIFMTGICGDSLWLSDLFSDAPAFGENRRGRCRFWIF